MNITTSTYLRPASKFISDAGLSYIPPPLHDIKNLPVVIKEEYICNTRIAMMESDKIEIRGAKVHNLKNINVDIPLGKIVGISGVSGYCIRQRRARQLGNLTSPTTMRYTLWKTLYLIDMGPGGGQEGGRIVAAGTPSEVCANPDSVSARFIK